MTCACPSVASRPTSAARSVTPASSTRSPTRTSSPAGRTYAAGSTAARSVTRPFVASTSSWGTTASAPGGSGAPVKIRMASPRPIAREGSAPASTRPTTASAAPARVSPARTAYPSMDEFAHGGTSRRETISSASTRPSDATTSTRSVPSTETRDRIASSASSTLSIRALLYTVTRMDWSATVRAGYNRIVEPYLAQRSDDTPDVRLLARLIARLAPDSAVLDAGCGAGVPIARRLAESFRVTGVDFAAGAGGAGAAPRARRALRLRRRAGAGAPRRALRRDLLVLRDHSHPARRPRRPVRPPGAPAEARRPGTVLRRRRGPPVLAATNERLIEAAGLQIEWTKRVADTGAPGAGHLFVLARRSA